MSDHDPASGTFFTGNTSGGARVINANGNYVGRDHVENHFGGSESIQLFPQFVVPDAAYNRGGFRAECLQGTRTQVVNKFVHWLQLLNGAPVCWLSGSAGLGKSAICQTIAELCQRHDSLAASFFFLRGAGRRSEFSHFITTLAFQLTMSIPATKAYIQDLLRVDPTVPYQSIEVQFQKLIVDPVLTSAGQMRYMMIVFVDALDECNDRKSMKEFIDVLARAFTKYPLPLRFFLTSRAENHIRQSFAPGTVAHSKTFSLVLEDFDARHDIHAFLESRFKDIYTQNPRLMIGISPPWPSWYELYELVNKSSGLFIFASTLVDFVTDGIGAPQQKLRSVLKSHQGLDPLYTQILDAVPEIDCFRVVLATLMLLEEQPSINILADLLQLESGDVVYALMAIQSILRIPADNDTAVQLNHTSLRDFLTDKRRSNKFFVNPPTSHGIITCVCIKTMIRALRKDFFPSRGAQTYACKNWHIHLKAVIEAGSVDAIHVELLTILKEFRTSQGLEVWINELILDRFHEEKLDDLVSQLQSASVDLAEILRDLSKMYKRVGGEHSIS